LWHAKGFAFLEIMRSLHPNAAAKPLFTYQHLTRKNLKEKIDHKFMHVPTDWCWDLEKSSTEILDWNVSDHAPVLTKLVFAKK
jgi:exonuclease III